MRRTLARWTPGLSRPRAKDAWSRRWRLTLLGIAATAALGGCYVVPVQPAATVAVRPAAHACWHRGWWGPWGWHPGHWGVCA